MRKYVDEDYQNWTRMRHWLSTKICKNLIKNVEIAHSAEQVYSDTSFTLFPNLPKELRCAIWALAVACPRIVELERINKSVIPSYPDQPAYRPKHLLALWHVCQESRTEAASIHAHDVEWNVKEKVPGSRWMRYEHDIFHIKDLNYTISQAPDYFSWLEAVAISWDLVLRRDKIYQNGQGIIYALRTMHRLRVLIILIDDTIHISSIWAPRGSGLNVEYKGTGDTFSLYEDSKNIALRHAFVRAATGPFKEISRNTEYEAKIKESMAHRFEVDRSPMGIAPIVIVRSCALPHGVAMSMSGRLSESYSLDSDPNLSASSI